MHETLSFKKVEKTKQYSTLVQQGKKIRKSPEYGDHILAGVLISCLHNWVTYLDI